MFSAAGFVVIIFLAFLNNIGPSRMTRLTKPLPMYVDNGEIVTLPCLVNNISLVAWEGPCNSSTDYKTLYYDGLMKNPNLSGSIRLKTGINERIGYLDYDLIVSDFSKDNEGIYKCYSVIYNITDEKRYLVVLKSNPFIITIKNSNDGYIYGIEDKELVLVCEVSHGIQPSRISWFKDNVTVIDGLSGKLHYKFYPTREDHNKSVTCVAMIDALVEPLRKKMTLQIKYKPIVHFVDNETKVFEGYSNEIKCFTDSIPPAAHVYLRKDGIGSILKSCESSECNFNLDGLHNDSGTYTCTAENEIGEGKSTTTVRVLYPPNIIVSLDNYTLHCDAKGEPNNCSYVSWKHFSEQGDFLRSFRGSEYLTLNSTYSRYKLNGLYVCEVTNGIQNMAGNVIQSSNCSVQLHGDPEILPRTQLTQYGKYQASIDVTIFVYSVPTLTWTCKLQNGTEIQKTNLTKHLIEESIYERTVSLKGYVVSLQIIQLEKTDFTNYTFLLVNSNGSKRYTVRVTAKEIYEVSYNNYITFQPLHLVAWSVGTAFLGVIFTTLVFCLYRLRKTRSNVLVVPQNEHNDNETHYDEINETELDRLSYRNQQVETETAIRDAISEYGVMNASNSVSTRINRPQNICQGRHEHDCPITQSIEVIVDQSEPTNRNELFDEDGDERENIFDNRNSDNNDDEDTPAIYDDSSSNSEDLVLAQRNSYVNISKEYHFYQSLVVRSSEENETYTYDELKKKANPGTHYQNLEI